MNKIGTNGAPEDFVAALTAAKKAREQAKMGNVRKSPTPYERVLILKKTNGRCHICGGKIEPSSKWSADHVVPHIHEGESTPDNFLAAHPACNGARWFYAPEEFQIILKLGIWSRSEIEKDRGFGREMAVRFLAHERGKAKRKPSRALEHAPLQAAVLRT